MKKNSESIILTNVETNKIINNFLNSEGGKYRDIKLDYLLKILDEVKIYINKKINEFDLNEFKN